MISLENRYLKKPAEQLQAQAEAFADNGVESFSNLQKILLKYSAELGKIDNLDNLPTDLPQELIDAIQNNRQKYIDFLRQEKKDEIEFREQNILHYKKNFQPAILELKRKIAQGNYKELPEYLNSGSNGSAFKIEVNGKQYAAKFSSSITQANFEIKPLIRAKGIDHVAQLEAYSFEDGVVIMDLLPGTDVTKYTTESAPEYSDAHIIQLIETARELYANGLVVDPKPSNFLYDEESGFSILDFHLRKNSSYALGDMIIDLKTALTARKWPYIDWQAPDYDQKSKEQNIERNKIYLPMMVRFLTILDSKFPEILQEWREEFDKREANPRVSQNPLINRSSIPVDHPELAPHLKKLEEMGF